MNQHPREIGGAVVFVSNPWRDDYEYKSCVIDGKVDDY